MIDCTPHSEHDKQGCSRKAFLPPCCVCTAPGAGLHYGVVTCEACKAFYHRSLGKRDTPICKKKFGGFCNLKNVSGRRTCPGCRYKKCTETGMSKHGVLMGPYSSVTKIKHMKAYGDSVTERESAQMLSGDERLEIDGLTDNMRHLLQGWKEHPQYIDQRNIATATGLRLDVDIELFMSTMEFDQTELDGRLVYLKNGTEQTCLFTSQIIQFMKKIPEFASFDQGDQINLVKSSVVDFETIVHNELFDTAGESLMMFVNDDIIKVPLISMVSTTVKDLMLLVQFKMSDLKLTDQEKCLFLLVNVFGSDRGPFVDKKGVEKAQDHYSILMRKLLQRSDVSKTEKTFSKTCSLMQSIRSLSYEHDKMAEKLIMHPV